MLAPSYGFPARKCPHDYARTVENGFTRIRPTYNGISFATDPNARILTQIGNGAETSGLMMTEVPMTRLDTLYLRWVNWFGWFSLAVTFVLLGLFFLVKANVEFKMLHNERNLLD